MNAKGGSVSFQEWAQAWVHRVLLPGGLTLFGLAFLALAASFLQSHQRLQIAVQQWRRSADLLIEKRDVATLNALSERFLSEFPGSQMKIQSTLKTVWKYPASSEGTNHYNIQPLELKSLPSAHSLIYVPWSSAYQGPLLFGFCLLVLLGVAWLLVRKTLQSVSAEFGRVVIGIGGGKPTQIAELDLMLSTLSASQQREESLKSKVALGQLAAQVAHDIRSPLAALNMIEREASCLQEDTRLLLRSVTARIGDIANQLIQRNLEARSDTSLGGNESKAVPELISGLIESVMSEKRAQFKERAQLILETSINESALPAFAFIQPVEFKRLLSNLINNAAEAIPEEGRIRVTADLVRTEGFSPGSPTVIELRIIDTGVGIPEALLPKLGDRGKTYGKPDGSGLGIYHAKSQIEAWGGRLQIKSKPGAGTTLILQVAEVPAPRWFCSQLTIVPQSTVVILDDDPSIHGIWHSRLRDHSRLIHLTHSKQLEEWVQSFPRSEHTTFLVDYELNAESTNGLKLIERFKTGPRSILVTSRYEDPHVRSECQRLGVLLLPKRLAATIPIKRLGASLSSIQIS
jgi:signal transduction histidine kinase